MTPPGTRRATGTSWKTPAAARKHGPHSYVALSISLSLSLSLTHTLIICEPLHCATVLFYIVHCANRFYWRCVYLCVDAPAPKAPRASFPLKRALAEVSKLTILIGYLFSSGFNLIACVCFAE